MNINLKLAAFWFFLSTPGLAQYNRGTVIAVNISPSGTTVAADSRNHPTREKISDDMCKIRTFSNKFAVAITGISGHTSKSNPAKGWDGFEQLQVAFSRRPKSTRGFASEWALIMQTLFSRDLTENPSAVLGAISGPITPQTSLVNGLFVGSDNPRNVVIVQVMLAQRDGRYEATIQYAPPAPPHCAFVCAIGRTEVIDEINRGLTDRGRQWKEQLSRLTPSQRAIEAVRLTINNHPNRDDVGGAVDAVLISTKGIEWLQRKKICP